MAVPSKPWQREFENLIREVSGAYLFGIPLLYTMEMWWIGTYANLWKLILVLGLALGVNILLVRFIAADEPYSWTVTLDHALESVAVGVVASIVVLLVLNRIRLDDPLDSSLGKIIIQAVPLSIGAAVAFARLPHHEARTGEDIEPGQAQGWTAVFRQIGAVLAGSIFIAFPLAPTVEIRQLAGELEVPHQISLILFSLVVTYAIVFLSGFRARQPRRGRQASIRHAFSETALTYCLSLLVALAMLFIFEHVHLSDSIFTMLTQALILGLPAAIGGAAGRLAV